MNGSVVKNALILKLNVGQTGGGYIRVLTVIAGFSSFFLFFLIP